MRYPSPPPPELDDDTTAQCEAFAASGEVASERLVTESRRMCSFHRELRARINGHTPDSPTDPQRC